MNLWQREVGDISPRTFANRTAASEDLVLRLGIHKKLGGHRGCVNAVSFNPQGDILVSGSDDRMIMLWDWDSGVTKLSFHSGHSNNVFQARFMPCTNDQTIVTCAADGEVRHARIGEGGHVVTEMLGQHEGRAHRMAIEPGSPHIFYTCGEDGLVQHFDLRTKSATKLFFCKSFPDRFAYMPIVHLNTIAIDPRNPNLFAIGGSDEYARLYDIRKYKPDLSSEFGDPIDCFCPSNLIGNEQVGVTGLAFSDQSELLVTYNDELIYLFSKEQGLGSVPISSSTPKDFDMDADAEDGSSSISASSSAEGKSIPVPQVYKGHRNRDTVKGVSFFGPNCEYVVSGSDCGRIFIWRKKGGELLRVMEGDKHIVNCIEPHPYATMLASSGIENDIKIWIPNGTEPAPPVNLEELKQKRRGLPCRLVLPQDLARQILVLQRRDTNDEDAENVEFLDLMMNYTGGEGSSEDVDDEHESPSDHDSPGDCIVN